jgi:rRNA processing protein Krr1/Pno1
MDEILRYTDLAHAIQLARAHDLSDRDIVRALTGSMSHEEARKIAQRTAPLLEISIKEFMELRKNG